MMNVLEMKEKRATLINNARDLLDREENEKRDLSQEEFNQYNLMWEDIEKLAKKIKTHERQESAETELRSPVTPGTRPPVGGPPGVTDENRAEVQMQEYRNYCLGRGIGPELRALQVDKDIQAGYLVPPIEWIDKLIKEMDDEVFIRQFADVYQVTSSDSLGCPALDNDPADATWTSEIGTVTEDSTMSVGKRELKPQPCRKLLKVSKTLLRKVPSAEELVRSRLRYKFAITQEKGFLTGTGANEPLGVFTASANGISTGRDVSTGNSATEIGADNLFEQKYNIKASYRPRLRWVFHRDAVKQIAKLKDGESRFLLRPDLRVGQDLDTLLGYPVHESEYAPNTFTTGLYVGILGDFSFYMIAESLQFEIQRLVELYAATNQDGFIGNLECDGLPTLESAFSRVKLG